MQARRKKKESSTPEKEKFFHEIAIVRHFPSRFPTIAVMEKVFMFSSQALALLNENFPPPPTSVWAN